MNLDLSLENKPFEVLAPKRHYIAVVLDRSGSMGQNGVLDSTINGFNAQIDAINREATPETYVSLVTFGTSVSPIYFNRRNGQIEKLNRNNYRPEGWTALYDAVGYTIRRLENEAEYASDSTFLVMIVSDGYENRSVDYNAHSLANLIRNKQYTGRWTFTYMGSNQDLSQVATILNIPFANTLAFQSTAEGTASAFCASNAAIGSYLRSAKKGMMGTADFYSTTGSSVPDVTQTTTADPDPSLKV